MNTAQKEEQEELHPFFRYTEADFQPAIAKHLKAGDEIIHFAPGRFPTDRVGAIPLIEVKKPSRTDRFFLLVYRLPDGAEIYVNNHVEASLAWLHGRREITLYQFVDPDAIVPIRKKEAPSDDSR